ncbi:MAG: hypothetical protein ACK5LY_09275 [Lachnospirales bacterium]
MEKYIDKLYSGTNILFELSKKYTKSYVDKYRKVMFLKSEFIYTARNTSVERFLRYVRELHTVNNYMI